MKIVSLLCANRLLIKFSAIINRHPYLTTAWWSFSYCFIIALIIYLTLYNIDYAMIMIKLNMNDFGKLYYAAVSFLQGGNFYDLSPAMIIPVSPLELHIFLNLNPPHFHLLLLPFAIFSPKIALFLWSAISFIFSLTSLYIIFHEVKVLFNFWRLMLLIVALLAFAGTATVVVTGQISFILMLPLTLFWMNSRHGRWNAAAIYLGLSMAIKLFLIIFIPYLLLRKKWRALFIASGVALACYGVGLLLFGWDSYRLWLHSLKLADWHWMGINSSLQGFFSRLLAASPVFLPAFGKPTLIKPLWLATGGLIGLVTLALTTHDNSKEEVDRSLALLFVAAQLISPLGWIYYSWLAFGPIIALWVSWYEDWPKDREADKSLWRARNVLILFTLLGFLIPYNCLLLFQPNQFITFSSGSTYFWATLTLWAGLCVDWRLASRQILAGRVIGGRVP
jgi:hypothetical protein